MTTEHDRLLAEGPRVAPEPPTALEGGPAATPDSRPRPTRAPTGGARRGRGARPIQWRAWLPILFVALAISGSAGRGYAWIVPLVIVGLGVFGAWRRR